MSRKWYRVIEHGNYFTVQKKYLFIWMTQSYIKGNDTSKSYYMFDDVESAMGYIKNLIKKKKVVYVGSSDE